MYTKYYFRKLPNFVDQIAKLFLKTVCKRNSYPLLLYGLLQFFPSSWTQATSKGKIQEKKKKKHSSESKETIDNGGLDKAFPQPSFCSCCDSCFQE